MERVVVVGTSCSGTTTLARLIAEILKARHIELDALFWGPSWSEASTGSFRAAVREHISCDRWVVDGNYHTVRDIVWSRATDVIWLHYSFRVVFGRAVARTVRRVCRREELFGGNRESFRNAFLSRESILWWVITTHRRRKREYQALFDSDVFPSLPVRKLHRPEEADLLVERLHLKHREADEPDRYGSHDSCGIPREER